jgi:hypothetical protein
MGRQSRRSGPAIERKLGQMLGQDVELAPCVFEQKGGGDDCTNQAAERQAPAIDSEAAGSMRAVARQPHSHAPLEGV